MQIRGLAEASEGLGRPLKTFKALKVCLRPIGPLEAWLSFLKTDLRL